MIGNTYLIDKSIEENIAQYVDNVRIYDFSDKPHAFSNPANDSDGF